MANFKSVAVGYAGDELTENSNCFRFREASIGGYMVEKFSAFDVFQDKISAKRIESRSTPEGSANNLQLASIFPDIIETNHIRVLN